MLDFLKLENPILMYYDILLVLSMLLTALYMFKWHKHFDVHITLVYVLVPLSILGNVLVAHATDRAEAISVNQLSFIGGCFLQLIVTMMVFSLCGIGLNRFVRTPLYLLSTAMFLAAMSAGKSDLFYTKIEFVRVNGVGTLIKEYGVLHTVFYAMAFLYFLLSISAIVYTYFEKNQVSRKILWLLFFPQVVAMAAFFGGRKLIPGIELIPAAYVFAQIMFLFVISRISLYNVTDTAVDSLIQNGATGFVSFDFKHRYLSSNETAKAIFPSLKNLTVDRSINKSEYLSDLFGPWISAFRENEARDTAHYEKDGRFYEISLSWLYNNRRKKGYQLTIQDDTKNQMLIRQIHHFNEDLQKEVRKKTAHLEEMHDRLILSLATMVESRDNSTGGHIRRTSVGVRILLGAMEDRDLSESFRRNLIKAAPMHDLGKIAVDDAILRKPGRFEPEEYEKMKKHAPEGARIVHEILKDTDDVDFHLLAENVAHYHHERWDGRGYPDGLSGENIPLEARIMAVADVYDALVSKRVYKEKFTFDRAHEIMMEGMGSQFDPDMKDVYLRARPHLESFYLGADRAENA